MELAKEWYHRQHTEYYTAITQLENIIKLCGTSSTSSYKSISLTYIGIYNSINTKTDYYIVFVPKEQDTIWPYSNTLPYLYIRDATIHATTDFYKFINNDIKIFKYEDNTLKAPELTFMGNKSILHCINYDCDKEEQNLDYNNLYSNENLRLKLALRNPISLFADKDIILIAKNLQESKGPRFEFK